MIVAVTGLGREARLIAQPNVTTVAGGGNNGALRARIEDALVGGARHIISIGICGALSSSLEVGDCIVATEIVAGDERFPTDHSWRKGLLASIPAARDALLAGTDIILANAEEKRRLHLATGAAAADMESHVAASVARDRGLSFAAFRVVSDSARRTLPPAALVAMSQTGEIDLRALFRSLAVRPGQIPALIRTAWEAEKAFRVLFRCRHILAASAALPNLGELSFDMR